MPWKVYPKSDFSPYSIKPVERNEANYMIRAHYLHRWPGVVVLNLGMWKNSLLVGIYTFALPPRETMIRYKVKLAWELARLFILDSEPFNSESWFIAQNIRWIKRNFPQVEMLVSYADPSAFHSGLIYKASNWKSDGRTDDDRKTPRFDYQANGRMYSRRSHVPNGALITRIPRVSKFRFIYRLRKVART
jgi:hypothetical protein